MPCAISTLRPSAPPPRRKNSPPGTFDTFRKPNCKDFRETPIPEKHKMKKIFNAVAFLVTLTLSAIFILPVSPLLALGSVITVSALLSAPVPGYSFAVTLTTAEIVADLFDAFRKMIPALKYFATDFSSQGAKYGQQIIAHVASLPTAVTHDTVNGFFPSPTSARTLITDVPLTMDTWKDVILYFKANDLVADRNTKYTKTVNNAAFVLGKALIDSILYKVNSTNISNSLICTAANATAAKLRLFTAQLNSQGAGPMRHGLVSSAFMTGLLGDTVVASGDYFDQRQESGPFAILNNIAGFQGISEYPDFPSETSTSTGASAAFTAATSDLITSVAHGLIAGDRIRVSSAGTLPAGLSAATNYFVIASGLTADAFKVSATSGGSAVDITDTGTGVHTWFRYDNLNAFFFEERSVIVASRLPGDSVDLAIARGVPVPMKVEAQTDPESGLTVLALERFNTSTLDLELCFSVMFGSAVGRQGGTAGALMDNAGLRIIEA